MNSRPIDLALGLRVGHPGQRVEEALPGVDDVQPRRPSAATKSRSTCSALARPQQPVVDEDAGQLVADRPLHERRRHRRVDAAGQPADRPTVADLLPDRRDLLLDDRARSSSSGAMPAMSCRKRSQHLLAVRRSARPRGGTARRPAGAPGPRRPRPAPAPTPPSPRSPAGAATTESPWLIHTGLPASAGPRAGRRRVGDRQLGAAVLARARCCATSPPSACAIAWKP